MTTTQPPLKPGDEVWIKARVTADGRWLSVVRRGSATVRTGDGWDLNPDAVDWHPTPGPTATDPDTAAHVAELEATLRAQTREYGVTLGDLKRLRRYVADLEAEHVQLGTDAATAMRGVDRMRPVVAAALEWQAHRHRNEIAAKATTAVALWEAVDAYRAGQNAPAGPPSEPVAAQQTSAGRTDTSEPQKGAEAADPDWCQYTDHDLFTNRRLRCDKLKHAKGMHRLVFADEPAELVEGERDTGRHVALALRRERDDLRERAEHYQRERDEFCQAEQRALRQRDEAAGKLDALRAGVKALAVEFAGNHRASGHMAWSLAHGRVCSLLAGDTSTPDGTTTAETGGAA